MRSPTAELCALALIAMLAACSVLPPSSYGPAAAGRRIFTDGIGADGQSIVRTGGMGMMSGGGCAPCHGGDGQGERTAMFDAPNVTYANLTDPAGMIEADGSRGMVYTDTLIRRAVIDGIGADGDSLDATMPRWQLTDTEWQDLLVYLKTLP